MRDSSPSPASDALSADVAGPGGAGPRRLRLSPVWTTPVSYRVQCWVAWAGLTAFALRGVVAWRAGDPPDLERLTAMVLSLAWGIDLLRGRSTPG